MDKLILAAVASAALLSPATANATPPSGHCLVTASIPHRVGNTVVGFGENECGYPAIVQSTWAGIEYKKCFIICWWSGSINAKPTSNGNLWGSRQFADAVVPWAGHHTYRVYVVGHCTNCQSTVGGQYGLEVKL